MADKKDTTVKPDQTWKGLCTGCDYPVGQEHHPQCPTLLDEESDDDNG